MTELRDLAVGFCFTADDLIGWVADDEATLVERAADRDLLGLPTGRGLLFPSWQLCGAGIPMAHMRDVLNALAKYDDDPWAWALWLRWRYPTTPIGEMTPMSWFAIGGDPAPIIDVIAQDAGHWHYVPEPAWEHGES